MLLRSGRFFFRPFFIYNIYILFDFVGAFFICACLACGNMLRAHSATGSNIWLCSAGNINIKPLYCWLCKHEHVRCEKLCCMRLFHSLGCFLMSMPHKYTRWNPFSCAGLVIVTSFLSIADSYRTTTNANSTLCVCVCILLVCLFLFFRFSSVLFSFVFATCFFLLCSFHFATSLYAFIFAASKKVKQITGALQLVECVCAARAILKHDDQSNKVGSKEWRKTQNYQTDCFMV